MVRLLKTTKTHYLFVFRLHPTHSLFSEGALTQGAKDAQIWHGGVVFDARCLVHSSQQARTQDWKKEHRQKICFKSKEAPTEENLLKFGHCPCRLDPPLHFMFGHLWPIFKQANVQTQSEEISSKILDLAHPHPPFLEKCQKSSRTKNSKKMPNGLYIYWRGFSRVVAVSMAMYVSMHVPSPCNLFQGLSLANSGLIAQQRSQDRFSILVVVVVVCMYVCMYIPSPCNLFWGLSSVQASPQKKVLKSGLKCQEVP